MKFSEEEMLKLDEILKFLNNEKLYEYDNQYLANNFRIPLEQFEFLYNKIAEFSMVEYPIAKILNQNTNYPKIECNYSTDCFIENGGFKEYYKLKRQKELENKKPNVIAENYIGGDNYGNQSSNSFSNNPSTINTIANPSNELKTNSVMLKFWKLTSENKLISGLLLVIILWAIKKYFNIDLKI